MKLMKNKLFNRFTTDLFPLETNARMKRATILGTILLLLPIALLSFTQTHSGLLFEEFMFRLIPITLIYPTIFLFLWKYAQPETSLTSSPITYGTFTITLILCCLTFIMCLIKPYWLDLKESTPVRTTGIITNITPQTTFIVPKQHITIEQEDGKLITLTTVTDESLVVGSYQTFNYHPHTKIIEN